MIHSLQKNRQSTAVFLDRDGTLIEDRGHLRSQEEVVFFPETAAALRRLHQHARLFIVTNQTGIGKGLLTSAEADTVNRHVVENLLREGVEIEQVYCCPHRRDEQCACIKPKPFFLEQAARTYGLDPARAFTVGDHPHDVEFAERAGATGIYVLSGHGERHRAELPSGKIVVPGIREATDWIIGQLTLNDLKENRPGLIEQAAHQLKAGGVVAFPTETVYGLGADIFNPQAVARIFEIKQRPHFDPLIAHVCDPGQLTELAQTLPAAAQDLMERFWPGPLTLVLQKNDRVPDLATAGLSSVAVRMPRHPLALELIRQAGTPIAAPSANRFGCTSPTTAQHVVEQLADQPDLILDGGACPIGVESTIIALTGGPPILLRTGGTPVEEIEQIIGPLRHAVEDPNRPEAPGQLARHYAPRTRLVLCDTPPANPDSTKAGLLTLRPPESPQAFVSVEILADGGNLRDAAARLFAAMHRLDALNLDVIYAQQVPDIGLGRAINDRLRRAAHPHHECST